MHEKTLRYSDLAHQIVFALFLPNFSEISGADPGFLEKGVHMYKGVCVGGGVVLLI